MAMKRFRNKALVVGMLSVLAMPAAALAQEAENAETAVEVTDTAKDESESHKVRELKKRVQELEGQLEEQAREHLELMEEVDSLSARQRAIEEGDSISHGYPATDNFLVEPGDGGDVSYTQDAINAQGDSTMVFSYSPSQLYKIYCKLNYLTDIQLKEGEQITFVGGGDTGKWMMDSATVEGTPHIYLKPIARGARTNIIINTTHHTYQVLCNEGDWYNPIIKWSYGSENIMESLAKQAAYDRTVKAVVESPAELTFDYAIRGSADWKPEHVFDDGRKTFIKFGRVPKKLPVLFVREKGHKEAMLVNYHVRQDTFIVERIFGTAELRLEGDTVKIVRTRK